MKAGALLAALLLTATSSLAAEYDLPLEFSPQGVLKSISDGPRQQKIVGNLLIFQDGYAKTTTLWDADVGGPWERNNDRPDVKGWYFTDRVLKLDGGKTLKIRRQTRDIGGGATQVRLLLEAVDAIKLDAIDYAISLPIDDFADGRVKLGSGGKPVALPIELKEGKKQIAEQGDTQYFEISSKSKTTITGRLDSPHYLFVQDARVFKSNEYQVCIRLHAGDLSAGDVVDCTIELSAKIPRDDKPATVTLDPTTKLQPFDGFGGNFVYGTSSPIIGAVLNAMTPAWARTGADLKLWEPSKELATTQPSANDTSGSELRKSFELKKKLFDLTHGRLIVTVWYLPEWLYAEPMQPGTQRESAGTVPEDRWPQLVECVGTYLEHLKQQYGVEPALFSFNESDLGIYLKLNGEETRKLTTLLGQDFEKRGLKTKLLLGDSAVLKLGIEQIAPTLADAEAMKYVGALAYHPWSGENTQWPVWRDAATKANLPLLATELGADAQGWQDGSFRSTRYFVAESTRAIQLVNDSGVNGILQWEWSDDYPLFRTHERVDQSTALDPTPRLRSMAQFVKTVPVDAHAVMTSSDRPSVVSATLVGVDEKQITLHLINREDARTIFIKGLPHATYRLLLTTPGPEQPAPPLHETKDGYDVFVPAQSHLTITTVNNKP